MLPVEQEHPVAAHAGGHLTEALLKSRAIDEPASRRPWRRGDAGRKQTLLMADERLRRDRLAVELVLHALELEIADEDPRQGAGEDKADGHHPCRRREEPEPQVQLSASSNR